MLTNLSREYLIARERYERAVRATIQSAEVMPDKGQFWRMLEDFRAVVYLYRNRDSRMVLAAEEFVRKTWVESGDAYDLDDLPAFVRSYGDLKDRLYKKLKVLEMTTDEFRDLIDVLPLAGRDVCVTLLREGCADKKTLNRLLIEHIEKMPEVCQELLLTVMRGENYVEHSLERGYIEKLCAVLTHSDTDFLKEVESILTADNP